MEKEKCKAIHDASMRVLEKTGMIFHHPDAVKLLKKKGIRVEGNRAFFTEEQVMHWVNMAPSDFVVHGLEERYDVVIGKGETVNGTSGGPTYVMDKDGTIRDALAQDFVNMIKLYEVNEDFGVNGGLACQPADIPIEVSTLLLYYLSLRLSKKVVWTACGDYKQMDAVMHLCMARYGLTKEELQEKPHTMEIVSTNTPLQLDVGMTETLFVCAEYRQPAAISAAAMAGTTSPVTLAGTLAVTNAEVLATIALAQMYSPGTPVLYGAQNTTADMATGQIAIGAPEGALCYKYGAEMARFYGIPSRAGGALTDAKYYDMQAGAESMLAYHSCHQNNVSLVYQAAGIMEGYLSVSFEKMIGDFEIIKMVKRYDRDIEINEDTLAEEVIDAVEPGGTFLMEMHTLKNCKKEPFIPDIYVRGVQDAPTEELGRRIEKKYNKMMRQYVKPEIDEETMENMRKVLKEYGISEKMIAKLDSYK